MKRIKKISVLLFALLLLLTTTLPAFADEPVGSDGAADTAAGAIRIAFIDTGISAKHLDPAKIADGRNYAFPEKDTDDRLGHGTSTAGIVLGSESLDIPSICENVLAVPLVCYDAYPSGARKNGGLEAVVAAVYDAVDELDCKIINISLGFSSSSDILLTAVNYAEERGVLVVSAAGNDNIKAPERNYYPASYPTVIGVGAADGLSPASYSQRNGVSVLAQGVGIKTATNKNADTPSIVSGTSFACAAISGVCARLLSETPDASPAAIRERLFSMAVDICEPGFDEDSGWGIVYSQPEDEAGFPFIDVAGDAWYRKAVEYVREKNLMNGMSDSRFAPDIEISRGQIVTILHRASGSPVADAASALSDVADNAYYTAAVDWASGQGLVNGYEDGSFKPDASVTREQLAAILYRLACLNGADFSGLGDSECPFADAGAISFFAYEAVCRMSGCGIINGKDGGIFDPGGTATRAQAAAMVERFCEYFAL